MIKLLKYTSILLLGLMVFSSCSKQKYTASFAPAKQKTWNKVETPKITKSDVVYTNDAVVANNSTIAAPAVNDNATKAINLSSENTVEKSINAPFNKMETKAVKKELRKTIFKQAKQNMFHKNSSNVKADNNMLIAVLLSLFIPPLGVWYFQEGITNDFWLDLVLLLTVVGSVIYALLVVFDIVSIA